MASCLVGKAGARAGGLLGGPGTDDPRYDRLADGLGQRYPACYGGNEPGLQMDVINGALAEELLRLSPVALPDHVRPANPAAARAYFASEEGPTLQSVGRCLAVHSPGMVNKVLATPAGSAAESQALEALFAETPECAVRQPPSGVSALEQRSAIAAGLYRWIHRS